MKPNSLMAMAYIVSQNSKCSSWRVGALIVKDDYVVSTGYNGTVSGHINCNDHAYDNGWLIEKENGEFELNKEFREEHSKWSKNNEIHAEQNAILYAARKNGNIEGSTLYVTMSPCQECIKSILAAGISKVVYCESYDKAEPDWQRPLLEGGVEIFQIPKIEINLINWNVVKNQLMNED